MSDIPYFRRDCEEEGAQNLKWINQILSELYFPHLRQLRQMTWGLTSTDVRPTSGLTWQLRVRGISTEMIAQRIYLKFPSTTSRKRLLRKWLLRKDWDLSAHWRGEKRLPETTDQDSSLVIWFSTVKSVICPRKLIGLKKRTRLGSSSSWDSRPVISIRSTESSTVATIHCCEHKFNGSVRRDPTNLTFWSRRGCQWNRISWVTLNCEGMVSTLALETDLSSHVKESSKRRLSCGSEWGTVSCFERHHPGISVQH